MRAPPTSTIAHQSVEDRKQLPHAGYQSDLLWLAGGQQSLVELLDDGVVPGGDQSTHVEGRPHRSPATPHLPFAAPLTGVAVEGSHSHQGAQALMGELAQLGQLSQESAGEDRTDTRDALEQCLVLLEGGVLLDGLVEVGVGAGELLFEPLDACLDPLVECSEARDHLETVILSDEHAKDLASSGQKSLQMLDLLISRYAVRR